MESDKMKSREHYVGGGPLRVKHVQLCGTHVEPGANSSLGQETAADVAGEDGGDFRAAEVGDH